MILIGRKHLLNDTRIDFLGIADEFQIDHALQYWNWITFRRVSFFAIIRLPSLPEMPQASAAQLVDLAHNLLVERAGQHHLDHFDGRCVRYPKAAGELAVDAQPV